MGNERRVRLFRVGPDQAVQIPVGFELPGNEAVMRKERDRLIIEPVEKSGILEWLRQQDAWDEEFPDVDEGLLPARDVDI